MECKKDVHENMLDLKSEKKLIKVKRNLGVKISPANSTNFKRSVRIFIPCVVI